MYWLTHRWTGATSALPHLSLWALAPTRHATQADKNTNPSWIATWSPIAHDYLPFEMLYKNYAVCPLLPGSAGLKTGPMSGLKTNCSFDSSMVFEVALPMAHNAEFNGNLAGRMFTRWQWSKTCLLIFCLCLARRATFQLFLISLVKRPTNSHGFPSAEGKWIHKQE